MSDQPCRSEPADDYAGLLLRMENGAPGVMWLTQSASGAENVLRIKVFGVRRRPGVGTGHAERY